MGRRTYSDVCKYVAATGQYLKTQIDGLVDGIEGWTGAQEAASGGLKGKLYVNVLMKIEGDKWYCINVVDEDPNRDGDRMTVFALEPACVKGLEKQCLSFHAKATPPDDEYQVLNIAGKEYGGPKESVELFLKDYGLKTHIEETDSVQQTI